MDHKNTNKATKHPAQHTAWIPQVAVKFVVCYLVALPYKERKCYGASLRTVVLDLEETHVNTRYRTNCSLVTSAPAC